MKKTPQYNLVELSLKDVKPLILAHHGYKSVGASATYCFGVIEKDQVVAAYVWQPPPCGAAKAVCPECPSGVLSLSRMVAVPRDQRLLNHVSKPLRRQMKLLIDRTRWPVLLTYSDEGQGHTGHVYKCSGWESTLKSKRPVFEDDEGHRRSSYSNGRHDTSKLIRRGFTTVQRWEHWICDRGSALNYMVSKGWLRVPVQGKTWKSGSQAYTWIKLAF